LSDNGNAALERAVQALYGSDPEREWVRMEHHRTEFASTCRALRAHLPPPPARILDCGGGPGRYAITLTKLGYEVTLFDLSPELLTLARRRAGEAEMQLAATDQGTATDLSRYPDAHFDAVLLMGPLYHLLNEADRRAALAEAYRVVKPGGPVFAAFIARYAAHIDAIADYPDIAFEHSDEYDQIAATGLLPPPCDGSVAFTAHFAHPSEVRPLCVSVDLEVDQVLAVEGLASGREEKINALNGAAWDYWADVNYQVAHDPTTHGGAEHLLAICRRPLWRAVLRRVAARLTAHGIDYVVVGGAALALRGLPLSVADLDLEMSIEAIYQVASWFEEAVELPVAWRETETVRSHFGRIKIDGIGIDLMAGLERRSGDRWAPSFTSTRDTVMLEGVAVHTVELEEEALAYLRQGRLDRAALALPRCDPERLRALLFRALHNGQL
jgi:S-adenosylmethionine-dependent methyltransferase